MDILWDYVLQATACALKQLPLLTLPALSLRSAWFLLLRDNTGSPSGPFRGSFAPKWNSCMKGRGKIKPMAWTSEWGVKDSYQQGSPDKFRVEKYFLKFSSFLKGNQRAARAFLQQSSTLTIRDDRWHNVGGEVLLGNTSWLRIAHFP